MVNVSFVDKLVVLGNQGMSWQLEVFLIMSPWNVGINDPGAPESPKGHVAELISTHALTEDGMLSYIVDHEEPLAANSIHYVSPKIGNNVSNQSLTGLHSPTTGMHLKKIMDTTIKTTLNYVQKTYYLNRIGPLGATSPWLKWCGESIIIARRQLSATH